MQTVYLMSKTGSVNYNYVGDFYSSRELADFAGQKSLTSQDEDLAFAVQSVRVNGSIVGVIEPENYLWDQMGEVLFGVDVGFSERRVWGFMNVFFPNGVPKLEFIRVGAGWFACLNGKNVGKVCEQDMEDWRGVYGQICIICEWMGS